VPPANGRDPNSAGVTKSGAAVAGRVGGVRLQSGQKGHHRGAGGFPVTLSFVHAISPVCLAQEGGREACLRQRQWPTWLYSGCGHH